MGSFAWVLSACADDPAIEDGQRAAEAVEMASEVVGLARAFAAPSTHVTDLPTAVHDAAAQATVAFTPSGCARVQTSADAVRVTFVSECRGPYGLRVLDGTVTATLALRDGDVAVALAGDLHTQRATTHPALTVTLTTVGAGYQIQYAGNFTGTGSRGTAVSFAGNGPGSLDDSCVQLNGSAAVTAGGDPWTLLVANYNRCADGCPASGGSLVINRAAGTQTRVDLSGGQNVSVTTSSGRAASATVPCGG